MLFSCKSLNTQKSTKQLEKGDTYLETPQILLINFEINVLDSIKLINYSLSPGKLRNLSSEKIGAGNDSLVISFLNSKNEECFLTSIENPLIKRVEFSDDFSNFKTQVLKLDNAEFSVRVQYNKCGEYIAVKKSVNNQLKTLKTFKLE
jgi:hypothetical protein